MNDKVEEDNKRALRKILIKKTLKRIAWYALILFIAFYLFVTYLVPVQDFIDRKISDRKDARATAKYEADKKEHDRLWTEDTFGGKTPEETMQMFIDALKANDAEEASKLYVVENQAWALEFYKRELSKNGNLDVPFDFYTELINKGKSNCRIESESCGYSYEYITDKEEILDFGDGDKLVIPKGGTQYIGIDLKINPYTSVWKIRK